MKETLHIYTRVSTAVQEDEGTSLVTQKEYGKKKATELGMKYKLWNEGAASSHYETLDNRQVLKQLLEEVEAGVVKHLYVSNNDRFSRNDITQGIIKAALSTNDVVLYTKDGKFNYSNNTDKLIKGVLDEFASYENAQRAERSIDGKLQKVKQGNWHGGGAVYGYQIVNKKLVLYPEESKWVKKIFKWYYEGKSIIWIKSELDKKGVLSKRGKSFSTGSLNALLKNTHHIGWYDFTDRKSGETVRVSCDATVDETIWQAVQDRRKRNFARKNQQNRTKKFYLLRDILVCGECETNMFGRQHTNKNGSQNIYYCAKKTRDWKKGKIADKDKWQRGKVGDMGCTMNRSLNISITDDVIWKLVMDTVSNSAILKEQFKKEVLPIHVKSDEENEKLLKVQNAKKTRLTKELQRAQESLADVKTEYVLKKLDDVVYQKMEKNLVAEVKSKKAELEQTRIRTKELANQKSWLDWLEKYGQDLELKSKLSKEDKKEYLQGLVDKIEVRLDKKTLNHKLKVFFRFGLVNDAIEYENEKSKSDGYKIIEGNKSASVVVSHEETKRIQQEARTAGRTKQVKKNDTTYHRTKKVCHSRVSQSGSVSLV